jgi:hypothetical protein
LWYNVNMQNDLPQAVRACLWSYDIDQIDLANPDHKRRIIENVLNRGTAPAVSWLLSHFTKEEIVGVIATSSVSEWNKKSLSLWSLVFDVLPTRAARFA